MQTLFNGMTLEQRHAQVESYLGKTVTIGIDRPMGYVHRKGDKTLVYPLNYGYIPDVLGGDGEELDVYLVGVDEMVETYTGRIVGIVYRADDVEDKLVMAPEGVSLTVEQMAEAVRFQEKYYHTTVSDGKGNAKEVKREQSIFDDEDFFKGYRALRKTEHNLNVLLEQPAMERLLPDLAGKRVLDLGCGYGHNCIDFVRRGAAEVVGVDLSERMLAVAKTESAHERIRYHRISMTDIGVLEGQFDLIYSSLAFHYIEDLAALMRLVSQKLARGGVLLFSQEHPIVTATVDGGGHFNKNEAGERVSYTFSDYNRPGKRVVRWFVDGVEKYHRPMGQILTDIARAGLVIEQVCEPLPEPWALDVLPTLHKEEIKPNFLIVRARKGE